MGQRLSIYVDHNATTPVHPQVVDAMLPLLREQYGNASSTHSAGRLARDAIERAREQVAALINSDPSEVVFTGSGTEACNLALRGSARARERGNRLVVSPVEHHAVSDCVRDLEGDGVDVTWLRVDRSGRVSPREVAASVDSDTFVVSVMFGNNEIGTLQPIREIGAQLADRDVVFHSDAVQAVGKVPVDVQTLGVDLLSLSAHKFHGPKGVGALYVKAGTPLRNILQGGAQEDGMRPGTYDAPSIVGMGVAAELARTSLEVDAGFVEALRGRLEQGIRRVVPGVVIVAEDAPRLPGTTLACFPNRRGTSLVENLDLHGICASTGAACSAGTTGPSDVMKAIGMAPDLAGGAVRFSLGPTNTNEDVDTVLSVLTDLLGGKRKRRLLGKALDAVRGARS